MNDRLATIDKIAAALHDRRRRRNPDHGKIPLAPPSERHDRIATAGECVGCRDDATYVVDELAPILEEARP